MKKLMLAVLLFGCGRPMPVAPTVPDAIKAPADQTAALEFFASGTQNYTCQQTNGAYAWTFTAPEATLYDGPDDKSPVYGQHSAGPTWKATDGTDFVGDSANAAKAASPDANSIPWLLIPKKSVDGTGDLSKMNFVQRVNTNGGVAPTTGCDASAAGQVQKVPYTANYYFYKAK